MSHYDLPAAELRQHRGGATPAGDLADFWSQQLALAEDGASATVVTEIDSRLSRLVVSDIEFSGAHGHRIKGWLLVPRDQDGPLPCVIEYIAYGGGRSLPHEFTLWTSLGAAVAVMDTRSQVWSDTTDPAVDVAPQVPGFVTSGILRPETHYYSRVFVDAARFIRSVQTIPGIDATRVAIHGGSQGGGIAVAGVALTSGLAPAHLRSVPLVGALIDVPFWTDVMRGASLVDGPPYGELQTYLRARPHDLPAVVRTLSYLDGAVLAAAAECPSLFSVGFMDDVCPPSTVYAAFNAWKGPKQIEEYPFGDHAGGDSRHGEIQLDWLAPKLATR